MEQESSHWITWIIFWGKNTSASAGFHPCPLAWSNWNFEMLVFVEGRKPEYSEKNPLNKARTRANSTLIWHQLESNPGRIGGKQVLLPLYHPCSPYTSACGKTQHVTVRTGGFASNHKPFLIMWSAKRPANNATGKYSSQGRTLNTHF